MRITVGQQTSETVDTFFLAPEPGEAWHLCPYPERPGVVRVRPGLACATPCDAVAMPHAALPPAPVLIDTPAKLDAVLETGTVEAARLGSSIDWHEDVTAAVEAGRVTVPPFIGLSKETEELPEPEPVKPTRRSR